MLCQCCSWSDILPKTLHKTPFFHNSCGKFPEKTACSCCYFLHDTLIHGVVARSHHPSSIQSSKPTSCCIVFLALLFGSHPKGCQFGSRRKMPGFQGLVERENIELDELNEHGLNDKLKGQMKELVKKYESMQANDGKAILRECRGRDGSVTASSIRKRDSITSSPLTSMVMQGHGRQQLRFVSS